MNGTKKEQLQVIFLFSFFFPPSPSPSPDPPAEEEKIWMHSFIRVSTAIAAEVSLESLLKTLMRILLETSGAER